MNYKRKLVNLYKDIVLVTRVHIFCTTLFINNNVKIVIQKNTFLEHHLYGINYLTFRKKKQYHIRYNFLWK